MLMIANKNLQSIAKGTFQHNLHPILTSCKRGKENAPSVPPTNGENPALESVPFPITFSRFSWHFPAIPPSARVLIRLPATILHAPRNACPPITPMAANEKAVQIRSQHPAEAPKSSPLSQSHFLCSLSLILIS